MLACGVFGAAASPASPAHDKKTAAARWDEQTPGCTFSQGPDGKLRYGMSLPDVAMFVAVDAQELEKVHRRHEPFFAVLLEVRNRGGQVLEVKPERSTLEFVQHFQVEQPALDPDEFSQKIQNDADALNDQAAREVEEESGKEGGKRKFRACIFKGLG